MSEMNKTIDPKAVREEIIKVLKTVYDPEIPVNIYDLGLIYSIEVNEKGEANIQMTFTSPNCPVAGSLLNEVNFKAENVVGVSDVFVKITWDPPWDKSMMSEEAELALSEFF